MVNVRTTYVRWRRFLRGGPEGRQRLETAQETEALGRAPRGRQEAGEWLRCERVLPRRKRGRGCRHGDHRLVNVGLSSLLVRRQDSRRWTRQQLPELVTKLSAAMSAWEVKIYETDWTLMPDADRASFAMDEAMAVFALVDQLQVLASPKTITAAQQMADAVGTIRMRYLEAPHESAPGEKPWPLYWDWSEAQYASISAACREMGLKPSPVSPGLQRHRQRRVEAVAAPTNSSASPTEPQSLEAESASGGEP